MGSGPGLDYGISFPDDTYASIAADAGGTGNFGVEPPPSTAVSFQQSGAFMNVAPGFVGNLSFYCANPNGSSNIKVYAGLNGTRQLLATFLPQTPYQSQQVPTGNLSPLLYTSVAFSGVAHSVDFIALAHRAYVDDISVTPVPEPTTGLMSLLAAGILGLAGMWQVRSKQQVATTR